MGLFSTDSGFAKFMSKAVDVLYLNILWLVFSLPIVTIGASTCAAFYVSLKMVDDEEGYIGRMFVKAFKDNFKQGTVMWIITSVSIYLCYLLWQVVIQSEDINFIIITGTIVFTAVVVCLNLYSYALIARYENTLKNVIRNSFGISMQHFGKTLLLIAIVAIEVVLIFWNKWTLIAGILIGPEFVIFSISGISKSIFKKIEKETKEV